MRKLWVAVTSAALVVAGLADSTAGFWGWRRCRLRPVCQPTCVDPCCAAPAGAMAACVAIESAGDPCSEVVSVPCLELPPEVILQAPTPDAETLPDAAPTPADPAPVSAAPPAAAPSKTAAPATETPPPLYVAPRPSAESTTSPARPTTMAPAPAERATAVRPQPTPAAPAETQPLAPTPAQPQSAGSSTTLPPALLDILGEAEPAVPSPTEPNAATEAATPTPTEPAAEVPTVDLWEAPTAEPRPAEEAAASEVTPGPAEEPADEAPEAFDPSELFGPGSTTPSAPAPSPAAEPSTAPVNRYGQPLFDPAPETRSPAPLLDAPLPAVEPLVAPPTSAAPQPAAAPATDSAPSESTEPEDEPQPPAAPPKLNPKDLFGSRTPHSVLLEPGGLGSFAVRRWQDISGRYALEARLRRITPAGVVLEGADGAQAEVELVALSTEDLRFLQRQIVAKRADLAQQRERGPKTFVAQSPEER